MRVPYFPTCLQSSIEPVPVMPLIGVCCKLRGREPIEAGVRSVSAVVDFPVFDGPARVAKLGEQMMVVALVA